MCQFESERAMYHKVQAVSLHRPTHVRYACGGPSHSVNTSLPIGPVGKASFWRVGEMGGQTSSSLPIGRVGKASFWRVGERGSNLSFLGPVIPVT